MAVTDPVHDLAHDHAYLNRQVLALASQIRSLAAHGGGTALLLDGLTALRDHLFLHFAREEEGLFPFVTDTLPDLAAPVHAMETAHDTICGGLARMVHLASTDAAASSLAPLFERFENAYATHARTESELLATLESRLDGELRRRLGALVDGL